jgi:hypothetical protein
LPKFTQALHDLSLAQALPSLPQALPSNAQAFPKLKTTYNILLCCLRFMQHWQESQFQS